MSGEPPNDFPSPRRGSYHTRMDSEDDSIINTRSLEAFSRKIQATAGHLIGPSNNYSDTSGTSNGSTSMTAQNYYQNAIGEIHRELRQRPGMQRQIFSLSQSTPRELVRSKLSVNEIQHRALTYLPDEMLANAPENRSTYSLFQGFEASVPQEEKRRKKHSRHGSRGRKLLRDRDGSTSPSAQGESSRLSGLRTEKHTLDHRLEMLGVRRNMCSTEIHEIDTKISNLNNMRKIILDRLDELEQEETQLENELFELDSQIEEVEEAEEDAAALAGDKTPTRSPASTNEEEEEERIKTPESPGMEASFMSESIYEKLPLSDKKSSAKRPKPNRRRTNFMPHENLSSGSNIQEFQAHDDTISALDFDAPFGTMVTAGLDDTLRVWDLGAGRCIGLLEGHLSLVRCLQVEDNLVATGSMDASVRLWDLSQADYSVPSNSNHINHKSPKTKPSRNHNTPHSKDSPNTHDNDRDEEDDENDNFEDAPSSTSHTPNNPSSPQSGTFDTPSSNNSTSDCAMFTLKAHIGEITALHMHNTTLISGSADKTLRQWDLTKGRCVQTLDVLWAAAQASTLNKTSSSSYSNSSSSTLYRNTSSRNTDSNADFVGAVQCFDAALACGTADGMVRLWDLRSGQVHRSLVGHTGPVTALQFDETYLVTGSSDRSVRIWDLRTGTIQDTWSYTNPITSLQFDQRHIITASNEPFVKCYDKADGRHWDLGVEEEGRSGSDGDGDGGGENRKAVVERVRVKEGYVVEGRRDGVVGVWSV